MQTLEPIVINPETFLRQHYSLPALPELLNQIQDIMYSPDVSVDKLAGLISEDASLVAQILKIVNSAYYSLPLEISKVRHAVAYLGMHEIHRIILSLSVVNTLSSKDKAEFREIWFHSLFTALCTKYLAQKYFVELNINELWSAALLHDIGKFVYLKFFPEHFKALRRHRLENSCLFTDAEAALEQPASAYLGGLLCDRWRLPEKIKNACLRHSLLDLKAFTETEESDPAEIVVAAGNLVAVLLENELKEQIKEGIQLAMQQAFNIEPDEFLLDMKETKKLKDTAKNLMKQLS